MNKFAIEGTVYFPLTFELFGHRVERQARATYLYMPAWPCLKPNGNEHLNDEEDLSMFLEVFLIPEHEIKPGSHDEVFPTEPHWVRFTEMLSLGLLNWQSRGALEELIEADAQRQDYERRLSMGKLPDMRDDGPDDAANGGNGSEV